MQLAVGFAKNRRDKLEAYAKQGGANEPGYRASPFLETNRKRRRAIRSRAAVRRRSGGERGESRCQQRGSLQRCVSKIPPAPAHCGKRTAPRQKTDRSR